MPIHDSSLVDAAFDTTTGFAYSATINEPGEAVADYTANVIRQHDVDVMSEESGIQVRTNTLEIRKADLNESTGLPRDTLVTLDGTTYTIEQLLEESTYTLTYTARK